ncbi:MAG: DUF2867 domain-containing protein [Chitinophagaceae bacterium]|nr:MAG: DUF2867 domain-containing protein [Chitinophagaceae bacterium]
MTTLSFALPDQSFLYNTLQRCHYIDRSEASFPDKEDSVQVTDAVQAFFSAKPGWLRPFLLAGNKVTALLGLKSLFAGVTEKENWWYDARAGKFISFPLQLFSHSENEIVLGTDDRHLSFRVSFFLLSNPDASNRKRLAITTMVQYHSTRGRFAFLPLQPLHKLVVNTFLKNAVANIDKNATT